MQFYTTEIKELANRALEYQERSHRVSQMDEVLTAIEESRNGMYHTLPKFIDIAVAGKFCDVPTEELVKLIEEQIKEDLQCDTKPTNA